MTKHEPDPVDVHVGQRIRVRRRQLEISQSSLAEVLGLTFQQVQKYEKGSNRVSASMLFRAAKHLGVPVGYFFDGLEGQAEGGSSADDVRAAAAFSVVPEIAHLPDLPPKQQRAVAGIISVLARH